MWHSADEKVTKCHFRGEGMNESEYIRHGGAKIEHCKLKLDFADVALCRRESD